MEAVRERIEKLVDPGSFEEWGALAGFATYGDDAELKEFTPANNVVGTGRVEGRKVVVSGDDFTVRGGAADASIHGKQVFAERMANELRLPIVRLVDGTRRRRQRQDPGDDLYRCAWDGAWRGDGDPAQLPCSRQPDAP